MEGDTPEIYYQGEDGYIVRDMTAEDSLTVCKWYHDTMGKVSIYDLQCSVQAWQKNSGFVIGEKHGKLISSSIRIPIGGGLHYGSMYYVIPEERRKGYGDMIRDKVARSFVGNEILVIDAVDSMVEPNKRRGYTDTGIRTYRFSGKAKSIGNTPANIKKVTSDNLNALITYDNTCFIAPNVPERKKLLQEWIGIPGGATVAYVNDSGEVLAFGFRKPTLDEKFHIIGPLYAENSTLAKHVISALCEDIQGSHYLIHVCDTNTDAMTLARELGLDEVFYSCRMYLNGIAPPVNNKVYSVTSIDFCGY